MSRCIRCNSAPCRCEVIEGVCGQIVKVPPSKRETITVQGSYTLIEQLTAEGDRLKSAIESALDASLDDKGDYCDGCTAMSNILLAALNFNNIKVE